MKISTLSLASVCLAVTVNGMASLATGAAPFQINIPNLKSGVEFQLTGLYLRPSDNQLDFARQGMIIPGQVPAVNTINMYSIKPGYHYGIEAGLGYIFPNSGNDVMIDWTNFNNNYSRTVSSPNQIISPIWNAQNNFILLTNTAAGRAEYKFNRVNLDVGQYINVGSRLQLHVFGGLSYVDLNRDLSARFYQNSSNMG